MKNAILMMILVLIVIPVFFAIGVKGGEARIIAMANKEKPVYSERWIDCECGERFGGTYIEPFYWFECSKCGRTYTNTNCNDVNEFYKLCGNSEKFEQRKVK